MPLKKKKTKASKVSKECEAAIWHGPGHQSKTNCHVTGKHSVHEAVYGSYAQTARWYGHEIFSGYFDEPPKFKKKFVRMSKTDGCYLESVTGGEPVWNWQPS